MSSINHHDQRHSYVPRSEIDFDDYSELGPEDSASQIGRTFAHHHDTAGSNHQHTRHATAAPPRTRENLGETYARQWMNGISQPPTARPHSQPDMGGVTGPPSRPASIRSSRIITPTTFVPSKRDRVRYSWQSIHVDEANRPRIHVVKIVSNTATASAGLPGGEVFGFSISSAGRRIACYNSARLFILQAAALPVNISQEYALRRRPLAVEVVDEGGTLAVLADEHTINVYDLTNGRVQRLKTFKTDYPTGTIALSPTGGLLAAAYESGVEIFSLAANALSTDRRAARSAKMDKLRFSEDGSTLIGTTTRVNAAASVYISVPVFPNQDNGIPTHEELKDAWCSNMLEPVNILDTSHATFLRERAGPNNERLFAWNAAEDTFGILNTQDLQYGNVDFPVTITPPLSTCGGLGAAIHSVPSLDERGETVGMIVNDRTIRLYMVPQIDDEQNTKIEAHSIDHELDEEFGCPFTDIRWVQSSASLPAPQGDPSQVSGRLVIVSPGGVVDPALAEDAVADVEQGRIILVDFDPQYSGQPGQTFTFTLGKAPPQTLDEEVVDVAQEVALVRRRTVNASQKIGQRAPTIGRAASMRRQAGTRTYGSAVEGQVQDNDRLIMQRGPSGGLDPSVILPDLDEVNEAIEEPYDGNHTRSVVSLQRAASAATTHRVQTRDEREAEMRAVKQDGFVPVPEYTEEANAPLPSRYRAMAGLDRPKTVGRLEGTPHLVNSMITRPKQDMSSNPSTIGGLGMTSLGAMPQSPRNAEARAGDLPSDLVSPVSQSTATGPLSPTRRERNVISPLEQPLGITIPPPPIRAPLSHLHQAPVSPATPRSATSSRIESRAEIEEREYERLEQERRDKAAVKIRADKSKAKHDAVMDKERRKRDKKDKKREGTATAPKTRFESRVNANYKVQLQQAAKTKQLRRETVSAPNLLDIAGGGSNGLLLPDPEEILASDIEPSKRETTLRWNYPSPELVRSQSMGVMMMGPQLSAGFDRDALYNAPFPLNDGQARRHSSHGAGESSVSSSQHHSHHPRADGAWRGGYPAPHNDPAHSNNPGTIGTLSTFGGNQVRPTSAPAGGYERASGSGFGRSRKRWWGGGGSGTGGGTLVGNVATGGKGPLTKRWRQDGTWTIEQERRCVVM